VDDRTHGGLLDALAVLRSRVADVHLALDTPAAGEGRLERAEVLGQLDDYLLPRLRSDAAPLLVVVGGSTGAGKSTLVNSLVGVPVSPAGVLRPTTRWPVLVHHPLDERWFSTDRVLPGLPRLMGSPPAEGTGGRSLTALVAQEIGSRTGLRLVTSDALPAGLALLDAPDIDSVVEENRVLATQLLGAADLWLFVTTAARYADAVPWELLAAAARRRVHLAIVLDRIDAGAAAPVAAHLRQMLDTHALSDAVILAVPEVTPVDGLLPERAVSAVADWLTQLGGDPVGRARVIARTRDGVTRDVLTRAGSIASAADDERRADARLRAAVTAAYDDALSQVLRSTSDGTLLRGEVLARWHDVVGTGEFLRAVEQKVSRARDRLVAAARGRRPPEPPLAHAIGRGLEAVVLDAAEEAAERAHGVWRHDPAGAGLLRGLDLSRSSGELRDHSAEQIRGWQSDVLGLVETEGAGKRTAARAASYGINGLGVVLMVAVFASTGGLTGAEVGIAGGTAVLAQRLLEAIFGDEAVRQLTRRAHERLSDRVAAVLDAEAARYTIQLDALGTAEASGDAVRAAVRAVVAAQDAAAATSADHLTEPSSVPVHPGQGHGHLRGAGLGPAPVEGRAERRQDSASPMGPGNGNGPGAGAGAGAGRLRGWWRRVVRGDGSDT
jgi:energy-coupling factor transporter ATP-binding protein EcfA2